MELTRPCSESCWSEHSERPKAVEHQISQNTQNGIHKNMAEWIQFIEMTTYEIRTVWWLSAGSQGDCNISRASQNIIRPAGKMGAIFFRNRKFAIGNISFVHCFCALFCKLFQIIGEISGSEVLALIRNNFAKLFSGQSPSLFRQVRRKYRFNCFQVLFQMKSPSWRSWRNLIPSLKEKNEALMWTE